jgi:hypothetical protein
MASSTYSFPHDNERHYQLEYEVIKGPRKGERAIVGRVDCLMTHQEVVTFRDAHTQHDHLLYHIVER